MTYEEKLKIANKYLQKNAEIDWDSLPDINSLNDADNEEEIIALCIDRLDEEGFPLELLED
jgi:hypothetical protein